MVAPAPGRMPTMVPRMEARIMTHLMVKNSFSFGNSVFTPEALPEVSILRGLIVCFSTSVTANIPIITGIISTPPSSVLLPHVKRARPSIGSMPMVESQRPMRPEMSVFTRLPPSRQVRTERPRKETANSSEGPNFSATAESCGLMSAIAKAATSPPKAEPMSETPSALPASPRWAIGYPSKVVGALEGVPGILNRMAVMPPPVMAEQ